MSAAAVTPTLSAAVASETLIPDVIDYLRENGALIEGTPYTGITNVVFRGDPQPSTPYAEFKVSAEFRAQVTTCLDLAGLGSCTLNAGHTI